MATDIDSYLANRTVPASLTYMHAQVARPIEPDVLFLWGTGEGWVTPAYLDAQRAQMAPNATLEAHEIGGVGSTGHWLVELQADRVLVHLSDFLRRHD